MADVVTSVERMYAYTDGADVTHLLYAGGPCTANQWNVFSIDGA